MWDLVLPIKLRLVQVASLLCQFVLVWEAWRRDIGQPAMSVCTGVGGMEEGYRPACYVSWCWYTDNDFMRLSQQVTVSQSRDVDISM